MKIFLWPLSRASKRMVVMQSRALHGVANFGRGQWLRVELLATTNHYYYVNINFKHLNSKVSWCSWLSRQSNTLKVSGSSPGDAIIFFWVILYSFNRRVAVKQQSYSVETNHLVKAFFLYKNGL